ncbi:MAG: hypothetical protein ABS46_15885 [Cytophagaceae bacterium SCN 52-12]|nr:MAG: hypothetical protein ABS46_15885 [Cytophagaceae bacterium SCN 52-12]
MFEKYRNFSAEDFATDDFFREWVFAKRSDANIFWTKWVKEHPEKREEVIQAIMLLKILQSEENELSPAEIGNAIERTLHKIGKNNPGRISRTPPAYQKWFRYAAAALILVLIGWAGSKNSWNRANDPAGLAIRPGEDWLTYENTGQGERQVTLEDGSRAVLDPESSIRVRRQWHGERLVVLLGGAFFDVVKNPDRPFKVLTENVVTQVLGTSFKVATDPVTRQTKVRVVTGKVEVSARNKPLPGPNTILYPNQEIVYSQDDEVMQKAVVEHPVEVRKSEQREFVYEGVPIGQIFDELEKRYAVKIRYDRETLADCQITASFSNESFWEILSLVCRPVRATAEEKDGEIFIRSSGCRF